MLIAGPCAENAVCYPEEVYCNKGYMRKKIHKNVQCRVFTPKTKQKITAAHKKKIKRKNEIEALIGELKEGHGMAGNLPEGKDRGG